jgi:hypothetical protein
MADRPGGRASEWTDEEIDAMAEIDEGAIADAARWWRGRAPARFRGLLDAAAAGEAGGGDGDGEGPAGGSDAGPRGA